MPGPWDGWRTPFTLLGGYLGAGKTTIVNHLVGAAGGRRIVVLVNDVGAIDVDAALIAEHDGATLSLTNGCVCCTLADDLTETLELVRALAEPPDHVLMELSGVAEPARVAPWANTAGFRLDGILVAADADQVVELAARDYIASTIVEQLRVADLVLLTKTDLAADGGMDARRFVTARSGARSSRSSTVGSTSTSCSDRTAGPASPIPTSASRPATPRRSSIRDGRHVPSSNSSSASYRPTWCVPRGSSCAETNGRPSRSRWSGGGVWCGGVPTSTPAAPAAS